MGNKQTVDHKTLTNNNKTVVENYSLWNNKIETYFRCEAHFI